MSLYAAALPCAPIGAFLFMTGLSNWAGNGHPWFGLLFIPAAILLAPPGVFLAGEYRDFRIRRAAAAGRRAR